MTSDMELIVAADGVARCIYDEALDLRELGKLQITRASRVEPDRDGFWWADMGPSGGGLPPLNVATFRERISGGENQGRARDATREEVHCRADHRKAPRG